MKADKAFEIGRDAGLDAIDALGEIFDGKDEGSVPAALTGLLTAIMTCAYAMAPEPEMADEIIATARKWAEEEAEKGSK